MATISNRIGVPLDKFTGNARFALGAACTLLGAAAAVLQLV